MAIAMIFDAPGVTEEHNDRVTEKLRQGGLTGLAEGQILHLAGPYDGGWRTVDVWESQEAADRFFRDHLSVAFAETGDVPVAGPPQAFPVHALST